MASMQLVVFTLNDQEYGIDVLSVNGILRSKKFKMQRLPGIPPVIEGVINLRGEIKYIFNLKHKFNITDKDYSNDSKIIMLNMHDSISGWIVDEITDIVKIDAENIEQAPDFLSNFNNRYIQCIGKINERMIIILDTEKVLTQTDFASIETTSKVS